MEGWHSAKKILKKKIKALCRVPHVLALGKESFKKNLKKSLPSAGRVDTRQSDRQRNRRRDGRFSLPSVSGALGKAFAECPIKYTRQRVLCRSIFCRVCFAECHTRQRLCRVQYSLCRVPQALGKEPESSSDGELGAVVGDSAVPAVAGWGEGPPLRFYFFSAGLSLIN